MPHSWLMASLSNNGSRPDEVAHQLAAPAKSRVYRGCRTTTKSPSSFATRMPRDSPPHWRNQRRETTRPQMDLENICKHPARTLSRSPMRPCAQTERRPATERQVPDAASNWFPNQSHRQHRKKILRTRQKQLPQELSRHDRTKPCPTRLNRRLAVLDERLDDRKNLFLGQRLVKRLTNCGVRNPLQTRQVHPSLFHGVVSVIGRL